MLMPLTCAWPPRPVAIGAGVGGNVSHRSLAKAGQVTRATREASQKPRMIFSRLVHHQLTAVWQAVGAEPRASLSACSRPRYGLGLKVRSSTGRLSCRLGKPTVKSN